MLSPAEADLVRRQPEIPGLATVLDSEAFTHALRRIAPLADVRSAQVTHVRLKAREFCSVTYRLVIADQELDADVRACRPEDLASWVKACRGSIHPGPLGPGLIVLDGIAVVLNPFPNDVRLSVLQHLADPAKSLGVLRELLPDWPSLWRGELRCLRYRPGLRYVAELSAADGARALVKAYARNPYVRSKTNAQAFQPCEGLRLARLLGFDEPRRLLAFEWLPGRVLADLCLSAVFDREALRATGKALAGLHAQQVDGLDSWSREAEARDLVALGSELSFLCPQLAERAERLSRQLAARLAVAPPLRCPLHGDFSANQVLFDRQEIAIVDLDGAFYGDPAEDLGNFVAQAERRALRGELPSNRVECLREALVAGYTSATNRPLPDRVALCTAVQLLRRARLPFRGLEPDWAERTEALIERAGAYEELAKGM